MIHLLSTVVRMKDSGVLSGRGGVRLSSPSPPTIANRNFYFLKGAANSLRGGRHFNI